MRARSGCIKTALFIDIGSVGMRDSAKEFPIETVFDENLASMKKILTNREKSVRLNA